MRTSKWRWLILAVALMGVSLVASACGSAQPSGSSSGSQAPAKKVTIGFANMADSIPFCQTVKSGVDQAAKAMGWSTVDVDNNLSGSTAVQNTSTLISRGVNFVIMYNIDAATQPAIAKMLKSAKIPGIAFDIYMPGFPFFGVNNNAVGNMGGKYLADYAKKNWGREPDLFVVLDNPMGGLYAKERSDGTEQGFLKVFPDFPASNIVRVTAGADVLTGKQAMSSVLTAHPSAKYIVVSGINDQLCNGGWAAIKQANRGKYAEVCSQGADSSFLAHLKATKGKDGWNAGVAYTPEDYGKAVMPIVQRMLNGEQVPQESYVQSFVVDASTVAKHYPAYAW